MKAKPIEVATLSFDGQNVRFKAMCPRCKNVRMGGWIFLVDEDNLPTFTREFYCVDCGQRIDPREQKMVAWGNPGIDYEVGCFCPR